MNILFCYISQKQKFLALRKSLYFGFLGFILIFISPNLPSFLEIKSFKFLSLLGIFFIIYGSLPYKQLSFLESHPHKIVMEQKFLIFYFFNLPLIKLSKDSINEIKYFSKKNHFGINLSIKINDKKTKIIFLEKRKKIIQKFLKKNLLEKTEDKITIFFPYFNENSFKKLKENI